MRLPVEALSRFRLGLAVWWLVAGWLPAQSSNQIWFAAYNGAPTPSADIGVQQLLTDGSAAALPAGAVNHFVSQTNVDTLNSPYDVAVDPAMGKAYVLDNNLSGATPEYIYSFNLQGTPAQIAASKRVIYTMPVPAADQNKNLYPLLSGIALDATRHWLYFNQFDVTTLTNSYLGRIDLTSSVGSSIHATNTNNPTVQTFHAGQIPGVGPIAVDATNVYLGAINGLAGVSGLYTAQRDGNGTFTELVSLSAGNTQFTNGLVSGVAVDPADHLIYFLTFNAGNVNFNFDLRQNALWVYDVTARISQRIAAGYAGFPDNLAIDPANGRYYFTIGHDGTGNVSPTNYQAIYTGRLGATNPPTLLFQPQLSGQDGAGQPNAGNVALQGLFIEDAPLLSSLSSAASYAALGTPATLAGSLMVTDDSATLLSNAQVTLAGGAVAGDVLQAATAGTAINAGFNPETETLTLAGYDTLANYEQVLRSVAYSSTNADPTLGGSDWQRTVTWVVNDGGMASAPVSTRINLVSTNGGALNEISISTATNGWVLHFVGTPSQNYVVQAAAAVNGPWSDLSGALPADSQGAIHYVDATSTGLAERFYRVRTWP